MAIASRDPLKRLVLFIACGVGAGALAGCATVPQDAGFGDVQRLTRDRTGLVVQWDERTADDQAVSTTVSQMLADGLTADQAAQIALLNNHHLQATFEDLGIAQADLVQAGLLKNPVFSLGVRFPDKAPSGTYVDIGVAEDFLDVALLSARKKLAADQFEMAKAHVSDEVLNLVAEARADFYTYQAAQQTADLWRTISQAATASDNVEKALHDKGNLSDLDFANGQAESIGAQVDFADAQAAADVAREKLEEVMGLWGNEPQWKVSGRLADIPVNDWSADGLEALAMLQRQDIQAARQDVLVQTRKLGMTSDYRFFSEVNIGPEFEHETDGQWRIGPSVSLPVPLFDQEQASVARAQAVYRQSRERFLAQLVDVRGQVRLARSQWLTARKKALLYREQVIPVQEQALNQTQLQYNGMYVGVFQLLEAKRRWIDAEREYIESLRDYWIARAELERAVGGRIGDTP